MSGVLADERLSDLDALVWRVEHRPRNRTTMAALARFDRPLDRVDLRHRVDRASRVIPRLRQRVVEDPVPPHALRWSVDPEFRLGFHLRRLDLAGAGDDVLPALVRDLVTQPFDRTRPLWDITHLTGLADGGDALLLKSHHAVSDGVGGARLMLELFDLDGDTPARPADLPAPPRAPQDGPVSAAPLCGEIATALAGCRAVLDAVARLGSVDEAAAAGRRLGETLGSAARLVRPAPPSRAVPPTRSDHLDLRWHCVPLDALRTAGRHVDGTINDAFVAGVALAVADHFAPETGAPLRISVPISTREGDGSTGNHWTPGRIDVDLAAGPEPRSLSETVRDAMRRVRHDPAHRIVGPLAAGMRHLPAPATAALFASFASGLDVAASNVPGSPVPLHLGGRPVRSLVPFGPLSGCAVNVTLLSHGDTAHLGVATDPAAVAEPDRFVDSLRRSFAVLTGTTV